MSIPSPHTLNPIGTLRSPFTGKFGLPRQPGLIRSATARVELWPPFNTLDAVRGLDGFSHIWLLFPFDRHHEKAWQPLVRPPRLGGNTKVGVFASRSSFRPNRLGMSVVTLRRIEADSPGVVLHIDCPDILDGTPIYDIKPYLGFVDSIQDSRDGYVSGAPETHLSVSFSAEALTQIRALPDVEYGDLEALIRETLAYDPRPAYKNMEDDKLYRLRLYDLDVVWQVLRNEAYVIGLAPVTPVLRYEESPSRTC